MGVGTPLLFPGFSPILDGADVTGPSKGATVGDFSEGLLGGARSLGVGPNEGEGVGSMVVTSFTVGPNEGESVGSMSVGSSVVGSVVEGCNVEVDKTYVCKLKMHSSFIKHQINTYLNRSR